MLMELITCAVFFFSFFQYVHPNSEVRWVCVCVCVCACAGGGGWKRMEVSAGRAEQTLMAVGN